jgi:hypothetical protein
MAMLPCAGRVIFLEAVKRYRWSTLISLHHYFVLQDTRNQEVAVMPFKKV